MAPKKTEKKSNGSPKKVVKELNAKDRKALEKKREHLYSVKSIGEDLPYGMTEAIYSLTDKKELKEFKACLKTGDIDGTKFFAAIDKLQAEWKALNEKVSKAAKAAEKDIDVLDKQLGTDEPRDHAPASDTFTF
jgi:hypothetical protein